MCANRPSNKAIAEQNDCLMRQYNHFQIAADYVAKAFSQLNAVKKVVLFGSVAKPLYKEVPRFREFRHWNIEVWHECQDVDLAVWLSDLSCLNALQKARGMAMNLLFQEKDIGVAHHQIDVFIMDAATNRYLGRLCRFGQCPKGKMECLASGCGNPQFLRQIPDFVLYENVFADGQCKTLFERKQSIKRTSMQCFVCGNELEPTLALDEREDPFICPPGLHFRDLGNFGSSIHDTLIDNKSFEIVICDECLKKNWHRGRLVNCKH